MKKKYLFIAAALLGMSLSGCYDLDQQPQGELSSANAFRTTGEITLYLNQFYQGSVQISGGGSVSNTVVKGQSTNVGNASGIAFTDLNSDDLIESAYYKYYAGHDVTLQYTFEYDDNRQLVHATRTYTSSPNETDHVYNTWKNDNIATTTWELSSGNKLTTSYTYSDEPSWKALITRLSYAAGGYNQNYDPIGVGSPAFYLINLTGYFGKRPKNILDETITRNQAGKVTGRFRYVMEEGSQYVEKDEDGYYTDYAVESLDGSSVKSRAIYDITWWE